VVGPEISNNIKRLDVLYAGLNRLQGEDKAEVWHKFISMTFVFKRLREDEKEERAHIFATEVWN
jgi:hypothetical protein